MRDSTECRGSSRQSSSRACRSKPRSQPTEDDRLARRDRDDPTLVPRPRGLRRANEKVASRAKVAQAIRTLDWDERVLCVRVKRVGHTVTYGDVIDVVTESGPRLDEVMLPKVQQARTSWRSTFSSPRSNATPAWRLAISASRPRLRRPGVSSTLKRYARRRLGWSRSSSVRLTRGFDRHARDDD